MYVSPSVPIHPTPPPWFPYIFSLCLCLYFCFANKIIYTIFSWRREWQPTPAFLPRESHGQRSLVGYIWSHRVRHDWSNLAYHFSRFCIYALIYIICISLPDLLQPVWQTLALFTSLQMELFHSFLWLSNVPLCIHTTFLCPFPCRCDTPMFHYL